MKKTSRRKPGRPRLGGVVLKTRLPEPTADALRARAAVDLRDVSAVIRDAVEAYLRAA